MVMLHGCTIGDGSLIGIGSILLNRSVIGKNSLVGANTLIPEGKVFPERSMIVGSPGKLVRQLNDEEVARVARSAAHYVNNWQRYQLELTPR
jgi:carbonic anhydrase/acetyltransferase-like protein (isoleucine patch superfamily)